MREFSGTVMRHSGDFWGGFAAMLVALPAAVAFGVTVYSAISPQYAAFGVLAGILGAVSLGLIAPTFGGINLSRVVPTGSNVNPTIRGWVLPSVRSGNCRWSLNSQKKRTNWQQN